MSGLSRLYSSRRWIEDNKKAVEPFSDDSGEVWAVPAPVLASLMSRVEVAVRPRLWIPLLISGQYSVVSLKYQPSGCPGPGASVISSSPARR